MAIHHLFRFAGAAGPDSGTGPGDLFITRNAGNVVPITSQDVDGVTATIEYAVEVLKVKSAILCGHSDCGAMKAALDQPGSGENAKGEALAEPRGSGFAHRQPLNPADGENAELASLIRGNVVAQLANLNAQPAVARAVAEGRMTVHGWYYDILSGRIEEYDEAAGGFVRWLLWISFGIGKGGFGKKRAAFAAAQVAPWRLSAVFTAEGSMYRLDSVEKRSAMNHRFRSPGNFGETFLTAIEKPGWIAKRRRASFAQCRLRRRRRLTLHGGFLHGLDWLSYRPPDRSYRRPCAEMLLSGTL